MRDFSAFRYGAMAVVLLTLGACASSPDKSEILTAEPASVSTTAKADDPAAPPTTTTVSAEELVSTPAAPKKKEGVLATIDKMEENPLTLYWRESNSYTYTIGSQLKAEYKPGESFVLKEGQAGEALECKYSANGELDTTGLDAAAADKVKKACGELMFTFDNMLSE